MSNITPQLLEGLLSANGAIRAQAEAAFQSLSVEDRIHGLVHQLSQGSSMHHTVLMAVLLRRDIVKLNSPTKLMDLVQPLLPIFQRTECSQVGDCLAEICASLSIVHSEALPSVLTTLLTALEGPCHEGNVPSLHLLAALAERAPMAFTGLAIDSLPKLLSTTWSPGALREWTKVLCNAAVATTVTKVTLGGPSAPSSLDDIVVNADSQATLLAPSLLPVLEYLCVVTTNENTLPILQELAQVTITCPSFLAGNREVLSALISSCLHVAQRHDTTLQLGSLDVLSSLISVSDVKRRLLTADQVNAIADTGVQLCARIMASTADDDDEAWTHRPASLLENAMDEDESDDYLFALDLMESFLVHLGALSVLLPCAESLLHSKSRVGLAVLECALVATPVSVTPHLPVIVQAATTLASSPEPRTQYQAIRLLGALFETHSPFMASLSPQHYLEPLAVALASSCSQMSAVASLALVSCCRNNAEAAASCLPALIEMLIQGPLSNTGMDPGSITVRVRAMGATACLAQVDVDAFQPHYGRIMQGLLGTLQVGSVDLAAAAMEAATIIGQVVGKDVFEADADKLLTWIMPILRNPDSPMLEACLLASARIASVLEEDFAPFVDSVVPLLLRRVQEPPEVSIVDGNDPTSNDGNDDNTDSMTIAVPGRGFTTITINTTRIQETVQAIRALYEHAKAMGGAFPYIQQSFDALLPLLTFPYSADVRSTSAQTLGAVFSAACLAGEECGMEQCQMYFPLLTESVSTQMAKEIDCDCDLDGLYAFADSLSDVCFTAYNYRKKQQETWVNFGLSNAQTSVEACMTSMVWCLKQRSKITSIVNNPTTSHDEKHDYDDQLRLLQQLLTPLVDSVGYMLKLHREDFVPLFERYIVPILGPKLQDQSDARASLAAICLFDDAVEHCGGNAAATFSPALMQGIASAFKLHNDDKDLLQAGVYGIAQIARYGPSSVLAPYIQALVHQLLTLTNRPKDEAADDNFLAEMAASALASLTLFGPFRELKFVPHEMLVNAFLSQLPILEDDDEAKICHEGLCQLMDTKAVSLENEATRLTRIIARVLVEVEQGEDIATPETVERMSSFLLSIQRAVAPSKLRETLDGLEPQEQHAIWAVLQESGVNRIRVVTP